MRDQFWYKFGFYGAILLKATFYGLTIYGIITQAWNREIPYAPLACLFAFLTWTRVVAIFEGTAFILNNMKAPVVNQNYNFNSKDLEDAVNAIMFKNMYGGSPN